MIKVNCGNCSKEIVLADKFCCRKCYWEFRSKHYVGDKSNGWKGGVNSVDKKCKKCGKDFIGNNKRIFCSKSCQVGWKSLGEKNINWKGGRYVDKDGYIMVLSKDHPFKNKMGYVQEHRLVMEKNLGRFLEKGEIVHHINENKADNHIKNLSLMLKTDHDRHHTVKRHLTLKRF